MRQRAFGLMGLLVGTAVVAATSGSAQATIVEFRFEGSLIDVAGTYSGDDFSLRLGDPVAYSYVIDLETPDSFPGGGLGVYDLVSAKVEIGDQTSAAVRPGSLSVDIFDPIDEVTAESSGFFGSDSGNVVMALRGPFSLRTDVIPIGFELADFPSRLLEFGLDTGADGWFAIDASVDRYTMTVIPGAGGAIAMVASACLLTGGRRRTRVRPGIRRHRCTNSVVTHTHRHFRRLSLATIAAIGVGVGTVTADRALAPCDSVVAPSYVLRDTPIDFDRLGTTIAVRSGWIYAGAPDAGGGAATDRGLVVAFEQVGSGWSERFTIERPGGPENGARFGDALATNGNVLAVGCPGEDAATTSNSGRVHLFQPGTTSATLLATLEKPGGPAPNDTFGASVALAFDAAADEYLLLVGTPLDDGAATNAGRADLFIASVTDLTAWTHVHTFVAPSASADDEFGSAVALTRDHVVIGAPFSEEAGPSDAGVAYLFARNPDGTWPAAATRLVSPDPPTYSGGLPGAGFGTAVAIDGDTIAVGAPRGRIQTQNCGIGTKPSLGTVDVFVREGTLWLHQEQIIGSGDDASAA